MKSYLLDTSAYSNMVRGHTDIAKIIRSADEIYVSIITLAELKYGFECGSRTMENRMLLTRFMNSRKVRTLIPDHYSVSEYARIGKKLKEAGNVMAHHDLWLIAQSVQNNLTLVSYDKDFMHADKAKIAGFKLKFLRQP